MANDIVLAGGTRNRGLPEPFVAARREIRSLETEEKLGLAVAPLRSVITQERSLPLGPAQFTVELASLNSSAREIGLALEIVDRELRRIPSLFSEVAASRGSREFWIPLPTRPERGGATIRSVDFGSWHFFLDLYGVVRDAAQSSPVAIGSFLLLMWELGRIPTRLARAWHLRTDNDRHLLTGRRRRELGVFKEGLELGRDAIRNGYSDIEFEAESADLRIRFAFHRRSAETVDRAPGDA